MGGSQRQPDFFIVGAPKAGTTALHAVLRSHPDINLPEGKDRPYFATDLHFRRWRLTREDYEAQLVAGADAPLIGHTCVWYLYSTRAAEEIRTAAPNAKIIVMLRSPIEMVHAQHSQFLYNGNEDITDFGEALAAEPDRRQGRRVPSSAHFPQGLLYTDTARYAAQVERYLLTFGQNRVHVAIHDDFRADPSATIGDMVRWLGVRPAATDATRVVNPNKRVRSRRLQAFLMVPPAPLVRAVHAVLPPRLHGKVGPWLIRRNVDRRPRDPISPAIRARLCEAFADDVGRLGMLIDRDLRGWLA